eukprot:jgi/Mesen1/10567/ME000843S10064
MLPQVRPRSSPKGGGGLPEGFWGGQLAARDLSPSSAVESCAAFLVSKVFSRAGPLWLAFALLLLCQLGFLWILAGTGGSPGGAFLMAVPGGAPGRLSHMRAADGPTGTRQLRIGIVSTYPPQRCGIAEYTRDLYTSLAELAPSPPDVGIIVVDEAGTPLAYTEEVRLVVRKRQLADYVAAAQYANAHFDVVVVQHEFGIFGGHYGDYLLAFAAALERPMHIFLHTVLKTVSMPYARHLAALLPRAARVSVAMPALCRQVAELAPGTACSDLPHGVAVRRNASAPPGIPEMYRAQLAGKKILMSVGLMGEDKGIDTLLQVVANISRKVPDLRYVIVGDQHPLDTSSYVSGLKLLAEEANITGHVLFVTAYQTKAQLLEWVAAADVVAVPHRDMEQVSSGTLSMAMGLGRAALATGFRYAQYLCDSERARAGAGAGGTGAGAGEGEGALERGEGQGKGTRREEGEEGKGERNGRLVGQGEGGRGSLREESKGGGSMQEKAEGEGEGKGGVGSLRPWWNVTGGVAA